MKRNTTTTTKTTAGKNKTIQLEGDISVNNIENIHRKLKAIKPESNIKLDIKNVTQFDLAGAQLLLAYHQKCKKDKINIDINIQLPDDLNLLTLNTGINKIFTNLNTLKI